jgi:DNA-binding Lrp family transcriptional regulator
MDKKELENEILYKIQTDFPLVERPFEDLAKKLDIREDEVINIIKKNKENKIIRQTSAIFDTKRLGYKSSLVAFKVSSEFIDNAAKIINAHPGVSHNYLRDNEFNIWFTLAVAPDSSLSLEESVEILKRRSGAKEALILPTIKMFKIAVKMDTTGKAAKKEKVKKRAFKEIELTKKHIDVIKELQKDIAVVSEPFKRSIELLNMSYDEFFNIANELKESGVMRRFAAILNHRKAGFGANAMSVWEVPNEKAEAIGKELASFSAVSHCYLRPSFPQWRYNIFAMVHAKSKDECNRLIDEMAKEVKISNYSKLYSTKEFKKQRLVYFSDAFREWEERNRDYL